MEVHILICSFRFYIMKQEYDDMKNVKLIANIKDENNGNQQTGNFREIN